MSVLIYLGAVAVMLAFGLLGATAASSNRYGWMIAALVGFALTGIASGFLSTVPWDRA